MEIPIYPNIREDVELIETFLWDPEKGAPDIDLHLERMCKSAANLKFKFEISEIKQKIVCLLYTSPSPRDGLLSRMPSSA